MTRQTTAIRERGVSGKSACKRTLAMVRGAASVVLLGTPPFPFYPGDSLMFVSVMCSHTLRIHGVRDGSVSKSVPTPRRNPPRDAHDRGTFVPEYGLCPPLSA